MDAAGDVADAMRVVLEEYPANSPEAAEAIKRRLAEIARRRQ